MERGLEIEKAVKGQKYVRLRKRLGLALVLLIVALVVFSGYLLFFYAKPCYSDTCFVSAMENCKRVSWIREDAQASWLYVIKGGSDGDSCKVKVKLLGMDEGAVDSESLLGKEMVCDVMKNEVSFPEEIISECTGVLKEELQEIIIQKMHSYLLENIGEIKEEFEV